MLNKSRAIDRLLRENPMLGERRYGLPDIGKRKDVKDLILQYKKYLMLLIFMVMVFEMIRF